MGGSRFGVLDEVFELETGEEGHETGAAVKEFLNQSKTIANKGGSRSETQGDKTELETREGTIKMRGKFEKKEKHGGCN